MKYFIAGVLLLTSQAVWSFEGFGHFQTMLQTIECVLKPGTDYLVCGPKTEKDGEQARIEENLIPYVDLEVQAVDPEFDYVWSHIQSFDITLELEPTFQECNFTGMSDDNPYEDVEYRIDLRDLNDDEYDDYVVVANCHSDVYYKGKTVAREYGADHWTEPFFAMFCGSEHGFYNCTEELTGHENVVNVAGDVLPGKITSAKQITLFDFNGDGIKDAIFPQSRDNGTGGNFHAGSEWFDAYFELMGMTRQEVIDTCRIISGRADYPDNDACWVYMTQHTYAISGPDGKWEIKTFDVPWAGDLNDGVTELYLKDGEYHVNLRSANTIGYTNWHVFNSDTNKFDFVAYGHKKEPWDISQNWNQYEIFADNTPWKKIGDKEYRIETNDESLGKGGVPYTNCEELWDRNYAECQFDQLHILSKDESGNVTKVMEYNVEDWIDDKRKVRVIPGGADTSSGLWPWENAPTVSYDLHGYVVHVTGGQAINADIRQLETRSDAPWYLIVSIEGFNDLRYPEGKFIPEIIYECPDLEWVYDDDGCWQYGSAIVFKYLIDFESNTLTYAGTLLEEENPFMWIGLDGKGPDVWTFEDQNGDGWKDITVNVAHSRTVFVSDDRGTYRYADIHSATPIMAYGRMDYSNFPDIRYDSNYVDLADFSSDGLTDYITVISGEVLGWKLEGEWRGEADPRLSDLYQPGRTYLDVVHGEYELMNEADVLDYIDLQQRFSECMDAAIKGKFTLYSPLRCYRGDWNE